MIYLPKEEASNSTECLMKNQSLKCWIQSQAAYVLQPWPLCTLCSYRDEDYQSLSLQSAGKIH